MFPHSFAELCIDVEDRFIVERGLVVPPLRCGFRFIKTAAFMYLDDGLMQVVDWRQVSRMIGWA